jgi:hypothetical protein
MKLMGDLALPAVTNSQNVILPNSFQPLRFIFLYTHKANLTN